MHWVSKLGGNIFSSIIFLYLNSVLRLWPHFTSHLPFFFTPPTNNVHAFQQREKLPMSRPSCWRNWMWLIKINVVKSEFFFFFFTFEVKGELREEREGDDLAFVCDSLPACTLLYLSSHFDPSHFSCHAIKRTGRNQRWLVTFSEAESGVMWWVASERAKIISMNSRKSTTWQKV